MEIIIDNITWNFHEHNSWDNLTLLGEACVGIPLNMLKRFIKECGWDDVNKPPHYSTEEPMEIIDDTHECYNSDTQIVLMNWLHGKQRKYRLPYLGEDPFWVYHDHCHSKGDVYSNEVNNINSYVEHYRIMEGALMAKHYEVYMKPKTAADIVKAWSGRFGYEGSSYQPMSELDISSCLENDEARKEFDYYMCL